MTIRLLSLSLASLLLASVAGAAVLAGGVGTDDPAKKQEPREPAASKQEPDARAVTIPFFGNKNCPVSGEAIDRTAVLELEGQPVYFCCKKCVAKGKDDPKAMLAKAYPADKVVDLKNTMCPVMAEPVGDATDTVTVMGRKMRLCCDGCAEDVVAHPVAMLARLENPKLVDLENKTCPISEKPAFGKFVAVYQGKMMRLCGDACVEKVRKDPEKALAAASKKEDKRKDEKKHH